MAAQMRDASPVDSRPWVDPENPLQRFFEGQAEGVGKVLEGKVQLPRSH
jgi:hypothetical protein